MQYKIVESREIISCFDDDRYILVVKKDNDVVGLNFMQGCDSDSLESFKKHYSDIDYKLTDFYNAVEPYLGGASELDRINQAIWAYFEFRNLSDTRKYNNK